MLKIVDSDELNDVDEAWCLSPYSERQIVRSKVFFFPSFFGRERGTERDCLKSEHDDGNR